MSGDGAVWLRVKRPCSDSPVESFNTVPAKRLCLNNESSGFTCFKYLGTSSIPVDSSSISLEDFKDMGASGERKVILVRSNVAHIVDSSQNTLQCDVRICEAQCRGIKRKAENIEDCCDPAIKSPPAKSIRIIDLTVKDPSLAISSALDNLEMDPASTSNEVRNEDSSILKESNDADSGFLYDFYGVSPDMDDILDIGPSVDVEDSDEFDEHLYRCDDSDSNSESNWRNDYPDEDDPLVIHSSDESIAGSHFGDEHECRRCRCSVEDL